MNKETLEALVSTIFQNMIVENDGLDVQVELGGLVVENQELNSLSVNQKLILLKALMKEADESNSVESQIIDKLSDIASLYKKYGSPL